MRFLTRLERFTTTAPAWVLAAACAAPAFGQAPSGTSEPVMRVQYAQPAAQPTAAADQPAAQVATRVIPAAAPAAVAPFDFTQLEGEHPLMPSLRFAKESLVTIDQHIQDYQAILYKQERIDGELMDTEVALVKVRHQPFSVHLYFLSPNKGRECLYVDPSATIPNTTSGKLHARDSGFRRKLGVFELPPDGRLAMAGQKYPITKIGVRNLATELVEVASKDVNYGECEVNVSQTVIGPKDGEKRPVTLIEVTHPIERSTFRFHKAQVFIDNELRIPIRYAAYLWPKAPGEAPPLEEAYTYLNLKVNNGFTDADFSRDNPELFKAE
jgi:hypothetical protein